MPDGTTLVDRRWPGPRVDVGGGTREPLAMAYDEGLAERIRSVLQDEPAVSEKEMFGGVAFLLDGRMFVGIVKDDLMVRVGPARNDEALRRPHVRPMDFTGRPMVGYVFVAPAGLSEDDELERWVQLGLEHAATLPKKTKAGTKKTKAAAKKTKTGAKKTKTARAKR
jgi:TfoX/Sxy family transcriptional regulator of competence genes